MKKLETFIDFLLVVSMWVMVLSLCLYTFYLAFGGVTFGGRCTKAGYEGAELELCIKRLSEGLPVYKENIEKWNKGY